MIQGLVASVNTKSSIKVDKINLYVSDVSSTGVAMNPSNDIENVRLYINGVLVDSTSNYNTAGYYEIGAYRDLMAGANTLEVRFDTRSTATVNNALTFSLTPASFVFGSNSTYNVSQNNVLLSDFNGSANGARLIIKNAGVDNISLVDSATNLTRVKESADFGAIKFGIRPSNVRDLVLNGFRLNIASFGGVNGATNSNFVTDATVVVDGRDVQTVSFSQWLSATFNSLGIIISKSSQKDIYVRVKTTSTHPDAAVNDVMYSVSSFDLQDINGNTINTINNVATSAYMLAGRMLDVAPAITINCNVQSVGVVGSVTTNASGTTVASYKFTSNYGASSLRELAIANVTSAGAAVSPTTTLISSYNANALLPNFDNSADGTTLMAYINGDLLGTATILNGIAYIRNINGGIGYTIPANGSVTVVVKAVASNTATNGVLMLRVIDPNLNTTALLDGSAQTLISAINSNSAVAGTCSTATANAAYIRKSNVTVAVNASSSVIRPILNVGDEVYATRLTADSANSVIVKKLSFNVSSTVGTTPTASNFAIKVSGVRYINWVDASCNYSSTIVAWVQSANTVVCEFIGSNIDGISIPAGSTVPFSLVVDSAAINIAAAGSISFNMSQQSNVGNAGTYAATSALLPNSFVWSDSSVVGHSLTTMDWYTDKSLTIDSFSQTYYRN